MGSSPCPGGAAPAAARPPGGFPGALSSSAPARGRLTWQGLSSCQQREMALRHLLWENLTVRPWLGGWGEPCLEGASSRLDSGLLMAPLGGPDGHRVASDSGFLTVRMFIRSLPLEESGLTYGSQSTRSCPNQTVLNGKTRKSGAVVVKGIILLIELQKSIAYLGNQECVNL